MKMISYMSLSSVSEKFATGEVENISIYDERPEKAGDIECYMVDIDTEMLTEKGLPVGEGYIYSVLHDGENIDKILCLEVAEWIRRVNRRKAKKQKQK